MSNQGVWRRSLLALILGAGAGSVAAESALLAEDGYLGELPVVLSVTRLAQSLADTPGAVTVIDRDMIRRTGARTVPELLRYVPGFTVSGWNGANSIANYHMRFDEYGARLQVFIDGRSVYSSLYLGDTHRGLAGVVMEDIERIEVLRGSNSAAYGSNAFLGVINIITRNAADTQGTLISTNLGSYGISDQTLRYGWGNEDVRFRITAARRSDDGYKEDKAYPAYYSNPNDDTSLKQVHFRGDMRLSATDDLQIGLGGVRNQTGEGTGNLGNAPYTATSETAYLQARWNRQLSATESFSLAATFDNESLDSRKYEDPRFFGIPYLIPVEQGGRSQRTQLEFSHTQKPLDSLRTVWGASWRYETAKSRSLFDTDREYSHSLSRLFGNVEWRLMPKLLLNAGGVVEYSSEVGSSLMPRLMLNWQPSPENTFRIGATKATRTPSLFELHGNNPVRDPVTGIVLEHEVKASGKASEERIYSHELGWLGDFREYGLTVDTRVFKEYARGRLSQRGGDPNDYVNVFDADAYGYEWQLQWRPQAGMRILFSQTRVNIDPDPKQEEQAIATPNTAYSLALFQDLPSNWEMALMYWHMSTMSWRSERDRLPANGVVNARVAKRMLFGSTRAEFAVTVQALDGDHYEFVSPRPMPAADPWGGNPIVPMVQRRAFMTMRLEF